MTADRRLLNASWWRSPATRRVMDALETARPGSARFVGGCVRNSLMGQPVDDVDIATQLRPTEVIAAADAAGLQAIPTGIEHGTVTIICERQPFEVTTLRRDVETDGRRAVVAFSEDWAEDAQRRDFRLNALYADAEGRIFDPTGGGLADAETGRIIFIGNADQRLREDYLRILRFFRFNAWYGAGVDADGLAACKRQQHGLQKIAAERIWKELFRLLGAPAPSAVLTAMVETGVLTQIMPEAGGLDLVTGLERVENIAQCPPDAVRRLICLLVSGQRTAEERRNIQTVSKRLRLPNKVRDRLLGFLGEFDVFPAVEPGTPDRAARIQIYQYGRAVFLDRLFHAWAGATPETDAAYAKLFELGKTWQPPVFPLRGEDALSIGLRGAAVGQALKAAESAWVESDFSMAEPELRAVLQKSA